MQQLLFLTSSFGISLSLSSSDNFHSRKPVCWKHVPRCLRLLLSFPSLPVPPLCSAVGAFLHALSKLDIHMEKLRRCCLEKMSAFGNLHI